RRQGGDPLDRPGELQAGRSGPGVAEAGAAAGRPDRQQAVPSPAGAAGVGAVYVGRGFAGVEAEARQRGVAAGFGGDRLDLGGP
ncbi:hypothetical protein DF186_20265, partial [Enterococcus hirae]